MYLVCIFSASERSLVSDHENRSDPIQTQKKKRAIRAVRQYSLVDSKRERRKEKVEKAKGKGKAGKLNRFPGWRGFREGSEERGCESSFHPVASKKGLSTLTAREQCEC